MWHEAVWVRHEQDCKRGMAWGQKWGMVAHKDRAWQYHSDVLKDKVYLPSYCSITGQPSFPYLAQACSLPKVINLSSGKIKVRWDGFSFAEFNLAPWLWKVAITLSFSQKKVAKELTREIDESPMWWLFSMNQNYPNCYTKKLKLVFTLPHFYSHLRKGIEAQRGYFAQGNLFG